MSSFHKIQDGKHRALPADFEMRGIPGYTLPVFPTSLAASIFVLTNQLLENEWRDRTEIEAGQLNQLRSLLQFAEQHSPFYAERIRACGMNPVALSGLKEFRRMLLLTRADLQDDFDAIRTRRLPQGTQSRGELKTSGSSGSPVRVVGTNVTSLMWAACNLRDHVWAGMNPLGSLVSIRHFAEEAHQVITDKGGHFPNWGQLIGQCFASGPLHAMDISQDVEAQLSFLTEANPDYLLSYPSNLETLGRMLVERGLGLSRLKIVQTIGEVLPRPVRYDIESAFNAPVWDLYSCVETGYVASQCPSGNGYHVHEENVLVEILDEQDEPCEPGHPGRVIITGLLNYASPIIRYDVGDYAAAMPEPCGCGRKLMGLTEIIGRKRGQLLLPDGRIRFNNRISAVLRDVGQVRQFQVIQHERDHVEVIIVPMQNFGEEQKKKITEGFQADLGFPIRVSFTLAPRIERTPGGKYLGFICKAT